MVMPTVISKHYSEQNILHTKNVFVLQLSFLLVGCHMLNVVCKIREFRRRKENVEPLSYKDV